MPSITIAGWELFPETITPETFIIGSPKPRRSLNGTGYNKYIGEKGRYVLTWSHMNPEEYYVISVVWERLKNEAVTVTCDDPYISGTFLRADGAKPFKYLEGSTGFMTGSLTIEEQ